MESKTLDLYTNENNPAGLKLLIAADLANKTVVIKKVNLNDNSISQPQHLPYLDVEGSIIFVPNAAVWFLLPPPDDVASKVNEWLEWEATSLAPSIALSLGSSIKDEQLKQTLKTCLGALNQALENKTNLIGETLTACDVAIWSTIYPLFKDPVLSKEFLSQHLHTLKWIQSYETTRFKEILKTFVLTGGSASFQAFLNGAKYLLPATTTIEMSTNQSPQHQPEAVTAEEVDSAKIAWQKNINTVSKLKLQQEVVLPIADKKNILITSALPYVNNVPHLGNIIGCVLSSDVFARFCRLCNYNTLFLGGTDEYGTATETKALEEGLSCQAICDKYFAIHDDIYKWFNISFDYFGRTTTHHQTEICQDMFLELNNNGFMFTEAVEQLHCEKCDRYLADRFVEGGCPHPGCTYEDARGDQCDGCGKLVNATELKNPKCKICGNKPELKTSTQFFFDLPKYFNPGGSIKDRIGFRMIEDAEKAGLLKPGSTIIEPTSGNTGIGLALGAAVKGYRCIIVISEKMSDEKVNVLKALGAEVVRTPVSAASDSPIGLFGVSNRLRKEIPNSIILDQYSNPGNPLAHYDTTAEEILDEFDHNIDMIVIGAGTGGTITGIGKKIKEASPKTIIVGADPEGSILALPEKVNKTNVDFYEIEGIGYDFVPTGLDRSIVDEWVKTNDKESFPMARRLIKEEGLLCGGSSGANMVAAIKAGAKLKAGQRLVVILPDSIRNYLTKFISDPWMEARNLKPCVNEHNHWWWDKSVKILDLGVLEVGLSTMVCSRALQIMKKHGIDQLPIVNNKGGIVSMVTMQKLLGGLTSGLIKPNEAIGRVCMNLFPKVPDTANLGLVSRILEVQQYVVVVQETSCLVENKNVSVEKPLGIVTAIDLLLYITNNEGK